VGAMTTLPPRQAAPAAPGRARTLAPGLAVAALAAAAATGVHALLPSVTALTAAVALGVLAANTRLLPAAARPGLDLTAKRVMRAAVALLGLRLSLGSVLALGWRTLLMVAVVVGVTFAGTRWLGRRAGLPGDQPLLIATGFSICGASAVAAVNGVTGSDEEDVVTAVALVTLCGSLAVAVLPLLHHPLGLSPAQFGRWAGASVHDVGQVVAVGQTAGPAALTQAVVVKLVRVALLAPLVCGVALARRSRARAGAAPRPVPLFLAAFVGCAALRSADVLPAGAIDTAGRVGDALMAAALFALGTTADLRVLLRTGRRAMAVGFGAWFVIAAVSYAGVRLAH
jgi:uncharacterized integral membrane protein (TIGR00698 family)